MNDISVKEDGTSVENENGWMDIIGSGGLKKKIIKDGIIESRPTRGDTAYISMKGCLKDGTTVELCDDLVFTLGDGEVIDGLDMVVALMDKGEESEVFMESRFAYGKLGKEPNIPPDTDLVYTIKLIDYKPEDDPESLKLEERKIIGNRKRERGNWWFNREDFSKAIQCYKTAVDFLDDTTDTYGDVTSLEVKEVLAERLKALNNMGAAQIKLEAYDVALKSLNAVLSCEPDNVKALYRKGKVLGIQGETNDAIEVLGKALTIEPENKGILSEIARLKEKAREESAKEKSLYRKMLGITFGNDKKKSKERHPTLRGFSFKIWAISFIVLLTLMTFLQSWQLISW